MKVKLKTGLIVLLTLIFSASLGYLVRQLYEGHKAESAFQSLAEQMSDMETEAETENLEEAETSETEEVPESRAASDEPIPLPVIKKGTRKTRTTMEVATEVTETEGENSPSAGVTEAEIQTTAPSVSAPPATRPIKTPSTADNQPRFYNNIPNCVGWLRIEGTAINCPVMQSKNDPDFYLRHAVSGEYSFAGVPYLDYRCEVGISNHLVIYGHNMKNGTISCLQRITGRSGDPCCTASNPAILRLSMWLPRRSAMSVVKRTGPCSGLIPGLNGAPVS